MVKGYETIQNYNSDTRRLLRHAVKGKEEFDISNNPEYQQALKQLHGLSGYYSDLMNPQGQAYQNFKAPMMNEFQQEIMPQIGERFAGLGGLSSSGFQQTSARAGEDLSTRLAALRSGLQMQGAQGLENLSMQQSTLGAMPFNALMQRLSAALGANPVSYLQKEQKRPGLGGQLLGRFGGALATGLGTAFGGPLGGAAAGGLMSFFNQ